MARQGNINLPASGLKAVFNRDEFTKLIESQGLAYNWSRAVVCPCRLNTDTDAYDPTCVRCVDGYRYVNPNYQLDRESTRTFEPIKAVFSSMSFNYATQTWVESPWVTGRGVLTVDGQIPVSTHDWFISTTQRATFGQVMTRLNQDLVPVGWLGRSGVQMAGAMRYEPIDVNYVENEDGTPYYFGDDFTMETVINQPVRMQWVAGRGPTVDERFTINYNCRPVWSADNATYAIQNAIGPATGFGLTGPRTIQYLPTTFSVTLDWLTTKRGD